MKLGLASLSLLACCLTLAAVPMVASDLYDNGPLNGNTDAWNIAFGFAVSDSFAINDRFGSATVTDFEGWFWEIPGDTLLSAELQIGTSEGDNSLFDQTVSFTSSNCTTNTYGFQICLETASFNGPTLSNNTYWVTLQNANTALGQSIYWDENSGPSSASENELGTIPSEAFTITGNGSSTTLTVTSCGTGPCGLAEPSSIMLFGSGILSLAGKFRRKLF